MHKNQQTAGENRTANCITKYKSLKIATKTTKIGLYHDMLFKLREWVYKALPISTNQSRYNIFI